jgi:peptidoglycan/LPS O-acetylase OafA/YrhL
VGIALTSIVLYTVPQPIKHLDAGRILTNLSMLQRGLGVKDVDGVYWTLWAELRFYMLFAIVIAMGVTYRRVMAFCVIWTAAAIFAEYGNSDLLATLVEPRYAPFFIGGIGIYLMHRFGSRPEIWLLIAMSWLLGQHKMITFAHAAQEHSRSRVSWAVCACLLALFYAVLIAVARGRLQAFNWRWLTVAGALTYPLYLIHESIGFVVIRHAHRYFAPHVLVALLVVAMLAAAYAVNRLIEEPVARRLKKWLAEPRPPAGGELSRAAGARPRLPSR